MVVRRSASACAGESVGVGSDAVGGGRSIREVEARVSSMQHIAGLVRIGPRRWVGLDGLRATVSTSGARSSQQVWQPRTEVSLLLPDDAARKPRIPDRDMTLEGATKAFAPATNL